MNARIDALGEAASHKCLEMINEAIKGVIMEGQSKRAVPHISPFMTLARGPFGSAQPKARFKFSIM